jgi:hypothetical protein
MLDKHFILFFFFGIYLLLVVAIDGLVEGYKIYMVLFLCFVLRCLRF